MQSYRVIVLCSSTASGALNSFREASMYKWNLGGDMRKIPTGINFVQDYLSYMLLHELMHAADDGQCKHEMDLGFDPPPTLGC